MRDFNEQALKRAGFEGWVTFDQLRDSELARVPAEGGVYIVVRGSGDRPEFLDANPGGRFKGRDPTVDLASLQANWVAGASVVYIGRSGNLKRRLNEFARFGAGAAIGHWGGRLIWQLADSTTLRVAWKPTPGADPNEIEADLLNEFRNAYGKPPFANDPHRLGA